MAEEACVQRLLRRRPALFRERAPVSRYTGGRDVRIACKLAGEYADMRLLARAAAERDREQDRVAAGEPEDCAPAETREPPEGVNPGRGDHGTVPGASPSALVVRGDSEKREKKRQKLIRLGASDVLKAESVAVASRRRRVEPVAPKWHAPWKVSKVIAGHVGWVRCVAVDPGGEFFFTGSNDRTIKCWDLASGRLKLTLTGHSHAVRGLAASENHPYLFSVGDDKTVKCWDLETNQVIRHYHGHLQGIHCVAVHPKLDVLVTGSRDASARVWDMRTRQEIHLLTGHEDSVEALLVNGADPQIITGSMDKTVKLWDLAAGKVMTTLTNHSKAIRALAKHPLEFSFASGAADCIKKWECREGRLMLNMSGHSGIVNALAVNQSDVLFSGGDDGTVRFWDWPSGHCFFEDRTVPQPGSLDSEACVLAAAFDPTGSRLITCEADKSIKIWKEDTNATPSSFPLSWDAEKAAEQQLRERY